MPLPAPQPRERKDTFLVRCMSSEPVKQEFPEVEQRYAICVRQWADADPVK